MRADMVYRPIRCHARTWPEAQSLLVDESADHLDGGCRLLFHDPVARIRDDAAFDVSGHDAHDRRLLAAERFLGAERKNWHRQFAFLGKRSVIDRILIESGKLVEGGMHGAWPRIELGIVASRRLIDRLRIG